MKYKNYNYLIKNMKAHDEQEMYEIVNRRIDKLISNSENSKMTLEALISCFEGASNVSEGISYISIAYALLVGLFSFGSMENRIIRFVMVVLIASVALALFGLYSYKKGQRQGFILNVLKFRYEDIKKQEIKEKDNLNYSADEKIYIVKIKRNN